MYDSQNEIIGIVTGDNMIDMSTYIVLYASFE